MELPPGLKLILYKPAERLTLGEIHKSPETWWQAENRLPWTGRLRCGESLQLAKSAGLLSGQARLLQGTIDGVVRDRSSDLLVQLPEQIADPPAHHAVHHGYRAVIDEPGQTKRALCVLPSLAASSEEAPSSTTAIGSGQRTYAASFVPSPFRSPWLQSLSR